jgi:hypothetical protein
MDKHDLAALKLAMSHASKEPARAAQLRSKLRDEPWTAVARFAAYVCQGQSLHLMQWESPPCWADEGDNDTAAKPLRQMLDLGISRWHPSPMSAIEETKRKGAA